MTFSGVISTFEVIGKSCVVSDLAFPHFLYWHPCFAIVYFSLHYLALCFTKNSWFKIAWSFEAYIKSAQY